MPVRDTVKRFEATGSPVITDGEQRKVPELLDLSVYALATRIRTASGFLSPPATLGECRGSPVGPFATGGMRTNS
jgi:5-methyltetrahydropteroyltriglutamate--homocysteine methyltransferase